MNFYTDVTIVLDSKEYSLHKVFLANSKFFDKLFKLNPTLDVFVLYFPIDDKTFKTVLKILYSTTKYNKVLENLNYNQLFKLYEACYYLDIREKFITNTKEIGKYNRLESIIRKNCNIISNQGFNPCVNEINRRIRHLLTKKNNFIVRNQADKLFNFIISLDPKMYSINFRLHNIIKIRLIYHNIASNITDLNSLTEWIYETRFNYFSNDELVKNSYRNFLLDLDDKILEYKMEHFG